jgi:hypothetical protein
LDISRHLGGVGGPHLRRWELAACAEGATWPFALFRHTFGRGKSECPPFKKNQVDWRSLFVSTGRSSDARPAPGPMALALRPAHGRFYHPLPTDPGCSIA